MGSKKCKKFWDKVGREGGVVRREQRDRNWRQSGDEPEYGKTRIDSHLMGCMDRETAGKRKGGASCLEREEKPIETPNDRETARRE